MPDIGALFCNKCHRLVTYYTSTKDGIQVFMGGKPIGAIWRGNIVVDIDGKQTTGFPIKCPIGHLNIIPQSEEAIEEGERLQFLCGTICFYHYRENVTCDQKHPCQECIVYRKYLGVEA